MTKTSFSMTIVRAAAVFAIWLGNLDSATAQAQKFQPDRLDVGTLYVGSLVEASIRIYWEETAKLKTMPEVAAPSFVVIRETAQGVQKPIGRWTDVLIRIDTSEPGEFRGEIHVQHEEGEVVIPVFATIAERAKNQRRVLIIETPFSRFSTNDGDLLDAWRKLVHASKIDATYLEAEKKGSILRDLDLSEFEVIMLGGGGVFWSTEEDARRLLEFVARGGRLIIGANRFMMGSVPKANAILRGRGLELLVI